MNKLENNRQITSEQENAIDNYLNQHYAEHNAIFKRKLVTEGIEEVIKNPIKYGLLALIDTEPDDLTDMNKIPALDKITDWRQGFKEQQKMFGRIFQRQEQLLDKLMEEHDKTIAEYNRRLFDLGEDKIKADQAWTDQNYVVSALEEELDKSRKIMAQVVENMYRALDRIRTDIGKYGLEEQFGLGENDYIQEALTVAKLCIT